MSEQIPELEQVALALEKMREPFPSWQISKLPKPTKAQTDALEKDRSHGIRCELCGGWHHKDTIHLDYVGHAALTDRLLDVDLWWHWEPLAYREGLPAFDESGGLWIKLTICGMTRIGYGHAAASSYKDIGSREKEVIGDALRNAAMRFGAALELWHKGDLHGTATFEALDKDLQNFMLEKAMEVAQCVAEGDVKAAIETIDGCQFDDDQYEAFWFKLDSKQRSTIKAGQAMLRATTLDELKKAWEGAPKHAHGALNSLKDHKKSELEKTNE